MAKSKRGIQEHLPGLAPEKNAKVHKQALIALDLKDEAKLAAKKAKEAEAHEIFLRYFLNILFLNDMGFLFLVKIQI